MLCLIATEMDGKGMQMVLRGRKSVEAQGKDELRALDGVRGIAILAVFFFHIATAGAFKTVPLLHTVALTGWMGVDLFFAMSGYLITRSAVSRKGRDGFLRGFYLSRARRILPVYGAALIVLVPLIFILFPDAPTLPDLRNGLMCLALFCTNMQTAMTSTAVSFGMNHFWSLAVEVQLYFVWPLLVLVLRRRQLMFFALALAILSISWRLYTAAATGNWIWTYFSTPTRLDSFSLGAAVYLLPASAFRRRVVWGTLSCSVVAGLVVAWFNSGIAFNQPWSNTLGIACAAFFSASLVMIIVDHRSAIVERVLSVAPLAKLGEISYSFYVFHFPLMALRWYGLTDPSYKQFGLGLARDLIMAAALFIVALVVSALSYRFIEKPFMASRGPTVARA